MAKITINWIEKKKTSAGKNLLEGSFIGEDGKEFDATIWELDKDNKSFPGFAELAPGYTFEGTPWTSPTTGKTSIYPPKPTPVRGGGANVAKNMERKEKAIEKFQDNKETSIKLSGAMRDAVALVTTFYPSVAEFASNVEKENFIKEKIRHWRRWLLDNHGDTTDVNDPLE